MHSPPLTAGRLAWLRRKGIDPHDLYELPPNHSLTEIDEAALAFPVYDAKGNPIDVCWFTPPWPRSRNRLCGKATFVNEAAITARTYTKDRPLCIWWTALNWLRAGRVGVVVLDPYQADALATIPWLAAESFWHGNESFDWPWAGFGSRVLIPKRCDL